MHYISAPSYLRVRRTFALSRCKRVQFAILFHILFVGCPMQEICPRLELYKFLVVHDLLALYWCVRSRWIMAEYIYDFVKQMQSTMIHVANFIALSTNETNIIDQSSIIVIPTYVLVDWHCKS